MKSQPNPDKFVLETEAAKIAQIMGNKGNFELYRQLLFDLLFLKALNVQSPPGLVLPPESWRRLMTNIDNPGIVGIAFTSMLELSKRNIFVKGIYKKDSSIVQYSAIIVKEIIKFLDSLPFEDIGNIDLYARLFEFLQSGVGAARSGNFFTPDCVAKLLVELLRPLHGEIYDPCCGTGTILFHAVQYNKQHSDMKKIAIFGEEGNDFLHRLCRMNLMLQGVDSKIKFNSDGSLLASAFPKLKADFILANPPYNQKYWGRENLMRDPRLIFGIPTDNNGNYAWIQHIVYHLSPCGKAGILLPVGSLAPNNHADRKIRNSLVESGLVESIILLPNRLFYSTAIPVCLWIIAKDHSRTGKRDKEILFIDASQFGIKISRKNIALTPNDIKRISGVYSNWRDAQSTYKDVPLLCKSISYDEIKKKKYSLIPGQYIDIPKVKFSEDDETFKRKMREIRREIKTYVDKEETLDREIQEEMEALGF